MRKMKNPVICPGCNANNTGKKTQTACYCPYCGLKNPFGDDKEKMAVYETLRNEIISTQGMRTTLIVYMYTVYFAVLTFGAAKQELIGINTQLSFVVSAVILVFFQSKIHRCSYTIARISAYIIVFFEADYKGIRWEQSNFINLDAKKAKNKTIKFVSSTGAPYLGIISLLGYCATKIKGIENLSLGEVYEVIKNQILEKVIEVIKNQSLEKVIEVIKNLNCLDVVFVIMILVCVFYLFHIHDDYAIAGNEKLNLIKVFQNYKSWKR